MSDLDLMDMHISALFRHDARGRILCSNEPHGYAAPRVYFGRTRQGNRWRFSHDLPDALAHELDALLSSEPPADDLSRPPAILEAVVRLLATYAPVTKIEAGPAWHFPDAVMPAEGATLIDAANAELLRPHFPWTIEEFLDRQPCAAAIRDGAAVALCCSSRNTDAAAEAGVHTIEQYRRQGHAAAVVATWAQAVRASGRVPLYSTDWDNLASQGIARKLGMVLYGADLSVT